MSCGLGGRRLYKLLLLVLLYNEVVTSTSASIATASFAAAPLAFNTSHEQTTLHVSSLTVSRGWISLSLIVLEHFPVNKTLVAWWQFWISHYYVFWYQLSADAAKVHLYISFEDTLKVFVQNATLAFYVMITSVASYMPTDKILATDLLFTVSGNATLSVCNWKCGDIFFS